MKLAIVPVRAGSKGIPHKNTRLLAGEAVLGRTLRTLVMSKVDRIVVATDDWSAVEIAEGLGSEKVEVFLRSASSASDDAPSEQVLHEVLVEFPEATIAGLIQVTSQMTTAADIDATFSLVEGGDYDSALTVARFPRFMWQPTSIGWNSQDYTLGQRPRRQDIVDVRYVENGAAYVFRRAGYLSSGCRLHGRIGAHIMPESSVLELDSLSDWYAIEGMLRHERTSRAKEVDRPSPCLLVCDVDGVMTDSGMYYGELSDELKRFHTRDGRAVTLLHGLGIRVAIVTSERAGLIERRARKIGADYCVTGSANKLADVQRLCAESELDFHRVAVVGDDLNDLPLIRAARWSFCPSDAVGEVREAAGRTCSAAGGRGVLREVAEYLLELR